MGWIPGLDRRRRRRGKGRGSLPGTIEVLERRALLADGIAPLPGPPLAGSPGVAFTNVPVATFTVTDQTGAPGTKWNALINWGDGQQDKLVVATPGPNGTFQILGTHTYSKAGTFPITVMIAVPNSHKPNDNVVTTSAVVQAAATGSVSGVVFNDLNDDGVQDGGEVGLKGWTVNLASGSTVVASAVTGSDGSYTIANVAPGNYTLSEAVQPGYTQTAPPPPGTYAVTVASGGAVSGKNFGNILPVLQSIAVTPSNPSVATGFHQQFSATGAFSDRSSRDLTPQVSWVSSNAAVATISNAPGSQGLAVAVAPGTTTVTATLNGVSGSTVLTANTATLRSIAVAPANPNINKGATLQLTAAGTFSDNTTKDVTSQVTWASATPSVASVSETGLATGLTQGTSVVSATLDGVTDSTVLTVNPAALKSIAVTPAAATLASGATLQFTATGTNTDNSTQDLTSRVTWTSANPSVATVSATGLASATGQGTTSIRATLGGVTNSAAITVGPPPPRTFPVAGVHFQAKQFKTFNRIVAYFKEPHTRSQNFHAFIDYGDHSKASRGHIHGEGKGRYAVVGSHRYVKPGVFPATVTIRDPAGVKTSVVSVIHVSAR